MCLSHVVYSRPFGCDTTSLIPRYGTGKSVALKEICYSSSHLKVMLHETILAQQTTAMLEQYCNLSKQCRNSVAGLCCAKNRRCESSCVTSPLGSKWLLSHT